MSRLEKRIWIDTDPSMGLVFRDVDDALALLQALRSPGLEIVGVSVSYGNAPMAACLKICRNLIRRYGAWGKVGLSQVYAGAKKAGMAQGKSAADEALICCLRKGP